jgi:hypothetical protein
MGISAMDAISYKWDFFEIEEPLQAVVSSPKTRKRLHRGKIILRGMFLSPLQIRLSP